MAHRYGKTAGVVASLALAAWAVGTGTAQTLAADVPRVLIIGDSISLGYTPFVKELLTNRAEVVHAPGNNAATVTGLKRLDTWLGDKKWEVIHFNFGLHDMKYIDPATSETDMAKLISVNTGKQWVPVAAYEANLKTLVQRLKKTGAKLVWCSTTPVPEGAQGRVPGDETVYNAAALRVMQAEGVPVNDLCAFVGSPERRAALGGKLKDVHYTPAGSRALAGEVAQAIEKALAR